MTDSPVPAQVERPPSPAHEAEHPPGPGARNHLAELGVLKPPSSAPRDASRGLRPLPGPDHSPKRSDSMSAIHCSSADRSCRENCFLSSPRTSSTRMRFKNPTGPPPPSGSVPCAKTASDGGAPTDLSGSLRIGRPPQPISSSSKEL